MFWIDGKHNHPETCSTRFSHPFRRSFQGFDSQCGGRSLLWRGCEWVLLNTKCIRNLRVKYNKTLQMDFYGKLSIIFLNERKTTSTWFCCCCCCTSCEPPISVLIVTWPSNAVVETMPGLRGHQDTSAVHWLVLGSS